MITNPGPECLDYPEISNFINVEIPKMLNRKDIAPYVTIAGRQVSAGPAPRNHISGSMDCHHCIATRTATPPYHKENSKA